MSTIYHFRTNPALSLNGAITVPGDKSISHRAIIFGSIAEGTTTINGFLEGEDCLATLAAFRAMGVVIEGPVQQKVVIHGVGKNGLKVPPHILDCGNSGTTMRLMTGLLSAQSFDSVLTGDGSLLKRPMARISAPLNQMGAAVLPSANGCPPIQINGNKSLSGITYQMPIASAQVKSCLLLAGMYAKGETTVIEPGISRDHTERMLASFSYPVVQSGASVSITSEGRCIGTEINIPGDISSAAFFMVAACIIPDAQLTIRSVGINPTRTGVIDILKLMGASIRLDNQRYYGGELVADIFIQQTPLKGITIPTELVPLAIDEFPVLFIAASCAQGTTLLKGARELRTKESDRISVMVEGLTLLGINAQSFDDGLSIQGGTLKGGTVVSHHDHRIAMAFTIAGLAATDPVLIKDCQNVATSFPTFIKTIQALNLVVEELYQDGC